MIVIDYLFCLVIFAIIYLSERLILFWRKKKSIWPLFDKDLLIDFIVYFALSLIFITLLHIVFRKTQNFNLVWLDVVIYTIVRLFKPHEIYALKKNKEKISIKKKSYLLGISLFVILIVEAFCFNAKAYSDKKETFKYDSFITETISSNGEIKENVITLKNKQTIVLTTNGKAYDNIYLHFDNDDMNLYLNIYQKKFGAEDYYMSSSFLIDPAINAYGYIPLKNMEETEYLQIAFDIDNSRYLSDETKPLIKVDKIEFDSYFPLIINPIRMGLIFLLFVIGANYKRLFISKEIKEDQSNIKALEKVVLFAGIVIVVYFFITALISHEMYFIKYDEVYLGGTSSNNIYYQQFDAYVKGQLHIDITPDPALVAMEDPYGGNRAGITYLWDHVFYNGKYYSYYGHAPIYLMMFPIYLVSGYIPTNLYILQFGVLFSIFTFVLATLMIIRLFIKKTSTPLVILTLISAVFGSLLFTNNTYEYGGMTYRIPFAYASGFLFLCVYLFIKGYLDEKHRKIYFPFFGLSLVFIVLSRPIQMLYLALLIPLVVKMVITYIKSKTSIKMIADFVPTVGVVLVGAIFVMVMNKVRFDSIFEFGEHYQLTVNDCRTNKLSLDGLLPTIYHYFIKAPNYTNGVLTYRYQPMQFDYHPYNVGSVGIFFMPITLFVFLLPFVFNKEDDIYFRLFAYLSPAVIFFVAFYVTCFAGVCPRYMGDIAPFAALTGGLIGLKAIEKNDGKHVIVPILVTSVLFINVYLSGQYHFLGFDGLRIGDFGGFFGLIRTVGNHYNV